MVIPGLIIGLFFALKLYECRMSSWLVSREHAFSKILKQINENSFLAKGLIWEVGLYGTYL